MMVLDSPGKGKLSPIGVTVITARATGPSRRRQQKHVLCPARCANIDRFSEIDIT